MSYLRLKIDKMLDYIRKYVSPVYVLLVFVSFTVWCMAKLSYTYTTDIKTRVEIDGRNYTLKCVVEGKGTNLLRYRFFKTPKIHIDGEELAYSVVRSYKTDEDGNQLSEMEKKVHLKHNSIQNAISVHFSDIKIISVQEIPDLPYEGFFKEHDGKNRSNRRNRKR